MIYSGDFDFPKRTKYMYACRCHFKEGKHGAVLLDVPTCFCRFRKGLSSENFPYRL